MKKTKTVTRELTQIHCDICGKPFDMYDEDGEVFRGLSEGGLQIPEPSPDICNECCRKVVSEALNLMIERIKNK